MSNKLLITIAITVIQSIILTYCFADYIGETMGCSSIIGSNVDNSYKDRVNVTVINKTKFTGNITTYGKIKAINTTMIKTPPFSGYKVYVGQINFVPGEIVKRGDVLVTLFSTELRYKQFIAQKDMEQHKEFFRKTQEAKDSISAHELYKSKINYEKAEAEYNLLKTTSSALIIKAPFDGKVGHCSLTTGEMLNTEKNIVQIVSHKNLNVEFFVDISNMENIKKNKIISIETWDNNIYAEAKIVGIEPYIDEHTNKVKVTADLLYTTPDFKHNLNVNVYIDKSPIENVFIIPKSSVIDDGSSSYLCKVVRQGPYTETRIIKIYVLDHKGENYAIIGDGIENGDYIVVEGLVKRDNMPVIIQSII